MVEPSHALLSVTAVAEQKLRAQEPPVQLFGETNSTPTARGLTADLTILEVAASNWY